MKKRSLLRKISYGLATLFLLLVVSIWIFLSYFFQQTLNAVLIPKIRQSVFTATRGRFTLSLDSIAYSNGTFTGNTFVLSRVARDSSEHGLGLEWISIDTVRFEGINWWDIIRGNVVKLTSLTMNTPKLSLGNLDFDTSIKLLTNYDTAIISPTKFSDLPVISFDSIILGRASVFLPKPSAKSIAPEYHNISITLREFLLDTKISAIHRPFFSKQIELYIPYGIYSLNDSLYSLEVHGVHASLADSLVTVDSFSYRPNYSEQEFADLHRYIQGQLSFACKTIAVTGIDFTSMMDKGSYHANSCKATSWNVEYYGDRRKPRNPNPSDAVLPHVLLNGIKTPILIDSIILSNGLIRHRERAPGSVHPSLITFTKTLVKISAFCTDTSSVHFNDPLSISVNSMFMGQGKIVGVVHYPIHQNNFDLQIDASVGPFDMPVLNSYLVTNERKEISAGTCLGGELRMSVHSGNATTMVCPRYKDLSMKILATDVHKSRGIFEGIKSFLANTFILRTKNFDTPDKKAFAGTTSYTYSKKEEFFEFIWLALRRSIGKVAGF
jgi:hypothetical protein